MKLLPGILGIAGISMIAAYVNVQEFIRIFKGILCRLKGKTRGI